MSELEKRLEALGYALPELPPYTASFAPGVIVGDVLFLSAQAWTEDGKPKVTGCVGAEVSFEQGAEVARRCALNALSAAKLALGSLDRVIGVVRMVGFVRSAPGFDRQAPMLNAASDMLVEIFGPSGRHARTSVGVSELSGGNAVLIEMTLALKPA